MSATNYYIARIPETECPEGLYIVEVGDPEPAVYFFEKDKQTKKEGRSQKYKVEKGGSLEKWTVTMIAGDSIDRDLDLDRIDAVWKWYDRQGRKGKFLLAEHPLINGSGIAIIHMQEPYAIISLSYDPQKTGPLYRYHHTMKNGDDYTEEYGLNLLHIQTGAEDQKERIITEAFAWYCGYLEWANLGGDDRSNVPWD